MWCWGRGAWLLKFAEKVVGRFAKAQPFGWGGSGCEIFSGLGWERVADVRVEEVDAVRRWIQSI